jgi:hypothetical protein
MRPKARSLLMASLLLLNLGLAGCANFDPDKFDLESLDVFGWSKKKPIPGDRKEVFPTGVPGVQQGVPAELTRGYQAPADTTATDPAKAAAEKVAAEEKPKPKPKPKKTAKATPPKSSPSQQQSPLQQQRVQQGTQAPWPTQQSQQQQQQPQQQQTQPWPSQQQQQQQTTPWPGSR